MNAIIILSACLAGEKCRYDGNSNLVEQVKIIQKDKKAMLVCPEVMGGLTTPREPAEIVGGTANDVLDGKAKVITISGKDVTKAFLDGAYKTLQFAKEVKATYFVLKENSPSCGSTLVYDGSHAGSKISGEGVTTALLRRHGFHVVSEKEITEICK